MIPGTDKLKAVQEAQPPHTVKQIQQFLGLCNFFWGRHIQNFSHITLLLTNLMKKDAGGKHGSLPENAMQAFHHLQSLLCLHPFWHIQGLIHNRPNNQCFIWQ
jgi:hypothetical protein